MNRELAVAMNVTQYSTTVSAPGISYVSLIKGQAKATTLLKLASANSKLSARKLRTFIKGKLKGYRLFQLSLEERATCSSACPLLDACYGNNMPFAQRWAHDATLIPMLRSEVAKLCKKYPTGVAVRLHVLGDFYSAEYVYAWREMLREHGNLAIYGYTHRVEPEIIIPIDATYREFGYRFNILQSDGGDEEIRPIASVDENSDLPICPQQTGKTTSCLDCGLCTNPGIRGVRFLIHSKVKGAKQMVQDRLRGAM